MHLYFFIRGIEPQVELWKSIASAQFWRWSRRRIKDGVKEDVLVQAGLRPSVLGLYEYIFPEECLSEVLAVLGVTELNWTNSFNEKIRRLALRYIVGLEKIPRLNLDEAKNIETSIILKGTMRGLSCLKNVPGVAIHPIGIKRDRRERVEAWGYEQEML